MKLLNKTECPLSFIEMWNDTDPKQSGVPCVTFFRHFTHYPHGMFSDYCLNKPKVRSAKSIIRSMSLL